MRYIADEQLQNLHVNPTPTVQIEATFYSNYSISVWKKKSISLYFYSIVFSSYFIFALKSQMIWNQQLELIQV